MIPLIEQHRAEIEAICRKYGVAKLELFGSAARGENFNFAESDVDFLVDFIDQGWEGMFDRWFGLQEDLEMLLDRKIDLVSPEKAVNPFFLRSVNQNRVPLYAA